MRCYMRVLSANHLKTYLFCCAVRVKLTREYIQ